ncbi:MAG: hypothetical protein WC958_01675 [Dehalococcoidales bacterium]
MKNGKKLIESDEEFFLKDNECQFLFGLAKKVAKDEVIIEIGDYQKNSTQWLAEGVQEGKGCKFYNMGSRFSIKETADEEAEPEVINEDLSEIVDFSYIDSEETVRRWKEKIGLLCINLACDFDNVSEIFNGWERHLSQKAKVVVYNCDTTVSSKIIKNKTGSTGKFVLEKTKNSLALMRLDKCTHHWILDSSDFGICKYCKRTRNFRKMLKESRSFEARRRTGGSKKNIKNAA